MKSNICIIKDGEGLSNILVEVEKVCTYNGLNSKETLRMRLLAEELVGMLPELTNNFDGSFWLENDGKKYELHVELLVDSMNREKKDNLIELSKNKKNASASGFMGKIRDIAENMLLSSEENSMYYAYQYEGFDHTYGSNMAYTHLWTLDTYSKSCEDKKDTSEWDCLEKSIVANLADDVIVGVRGKKVDIIIKKEF